MNVNCPECSTLYRVDPAKIPAAGVRTRCGRCGAVFRIGGEQEPVAAASGAATGAATGAEPGEAAAAPTSTPSAAASPAEPVTAAPAVATAPISAPAPAAMAAGGATAPPRASPLARPRPGAPPDPHSRARRLARALVSDIVAYHPDRRDRSLQAGTLRQDFRDEILKSWDEYVQQVGDETARKTPFFRDALNEILARGQKVF